MKKIGLFVLLGFLASCSLGNKGQADVILSIARPKSIGILQDKTPEQVTQILGEPSFVRTEAPHETWVFKAPDCALFVFFNDQGMSCYTETKGSCSKSVARRMQQEKNRTL